MKKQIVSTLLALCMLLCLMPTAAFAEDNTETPPADNAAAQQEEEMSDLQPETALTTLIGGNPTERNVSSESELTEAIENTNVNTVKLTANIDISSSLTVDRIVTLDLNGQVLKYVGESKGSVIVVEDGGNLTLMDSNDEKVHNFDKSVMPWALAADDAVGENIVAVPGGVITGGTGYPYQLYSTVNCGGGVYIAPGGQLTMTDGNIIGCSAKYGGGVCIYPKQDSKQGQFSMSGGSIIGCSAESGGGVCAFGKFQMSGQAVIRSCTVEGTSFYFGGGVWVDGSFEMSGEAIIEGCQAISEYAYGGGVYVNSSSSFVMSGKAKIERCQAISTPSSPSKGGGVHLANATTFTLSGNAVIQNCAAVNSADPGEAYGGGVSADNVKKITLADSASIADCNAANGSGLYITGSSWDPNVYGQLYANGGLVDGDVVLGNKDRNDEPCTITGLGGTVFNGKVTVTPGSTIEKGTFNGEVINNGTITGGVFNSTVSGNGTITGGTFNTPMTGSGTESAPYQISTAAQLKRFRNIVNGTGGQTPNAAACAVLTANIDLNNEPWTPIGNYTTTNEIFYEGTFDGGGHTISNLNVTDRFICAGLFGAVKGGTIKNLTVAGNVSHNYFVGQSGHVGGIVGGALDAATIENCSNNCSVTGSSSDFIGGIAGSNIDGARIIDCYNVGTITGTINGTGGVTGLNMGAISNCYNVGTFKGSSAVGEIVGNNYGTLENCYYLAGTNLNAVGQNNDNGNIRKTESKTAAEFANDTVLALLKADRNDSPWDSCQYVAAAGKTLPVFKGQGDAHEHNGNWTSNGDGTHSRRCTCNAVETVNCSGGKATCKDKAVCEICGKSYGSPDANNHTHLKHIEAKAATVAEEGNIAYWYCGDCNKYFSDAAAKTEITKADTVMPKLPPKITAGDGAAVTQSEKKELTFTSDASFADFVRVELDGTALEEKNYTKREGSTIITLNRDFVTALSVGEHTLAIVSKSGTATAKFTVKAKPTETAAPQPTAKPQLTAQPQQTAQQTVQPVSPIPGTGDTANPALWFALLIVSGSALAAISILRRKANRK